MSESNWVRLNYGDNMPINAIEAGADTDGTPIHVGRAVHENDLIPAKILYAKSAAYVSYNGQEIFKSEYEVLCENEDFRFKWVPASGGIVPDTGVMSGLTATGEYIYIGRAQIEGSLTPGKIHPTHGCLYVPFGGLEYSFPDYEALVAIRKLKWVAASNEHLPEGAILGGQDIDGTTMFVCRAEHERDLLPGKHMPDKGDAYVCIGGKEYKKEFVEVLCNGNTSWIPTSGGSIPFNAVPGGRAADGEMLFIGRAEYKKSLTVGKVHPSHGVLYIPFGGKEKKIKDYEILVDNDE